jgi:hypothetical protein
MKKYPLVTASSRRSRYGSAVPASLRTNRPGWVNAGTTWSSLSGPLWGPSAYVAQRQVGAVVQPDNGFERKRLESVEPPDMRNGQLLSQRQPPQRRALPVRVAVAKWATTVPSISYIHRSPCYSLSCAEVPTSSKGRARWRRRFPNRSWPYCGAARPGTRPVCCRANSEQLACTVHAPTLRSQEPPPSRPSPSSQDIQSAAPKEL